MCIFGNFKDTQEEILSKKSDTYYQVVISELYDSAATDNEPKKK